MRHNVCWENISQEVKMKTQLPCKSVWSHVLIKCFYWEETCGIVMYHELTAQMKQAKGITFHCCMSACMFISKTYFNWEFKINVDNCGLDKFWPSQKHSVACHKMVTSFTMYKYIPAKIFQNTTAASFLLDEKITEIIS